jgi:hypothetical protein
MVRLPRLTIRTENSHRFGHSRRGSLAPIAIFGLLTVLGMTALMLDRLWLEAAQAELITAAESAALASGQVLASDELLKEETDYEILADRARRCAVEIAASNRIAGAPVELDADAAGDIRFGRIVHRESTGEDVFVETLDGPLSVVVRAEHSRSRHNPVALFLNGFTNDEGGDVAALAEASIDNHIAGFQPLKGVPIPAVPLAILKADLSGTGLESWQAMIEQRQGADRYRFDETTHEISQEADGIPEITLHSAGFESDPTRVNSHLFVVNEKATQKDVAGHIQNGWYERDLPQSRQLLRFDRQSHELLTLDGIRGAFPRHLKQIVGECRLLFLFEQFELLSDSAACGRVRCVQAVAGRILKVTTHDDGSTDIVVQPGVLTTRTAVLARETVTQGPPERLANRYVYKLQLTQ